jgi:non-homologous end joining protein Ku
MKPITYYINLTDEERVHIVESLISLKSALLEQGKYTDAVDDVIVKMLKAKKKKFKVITKA